MKIHTLRTMLIVKNVERVTFSWEFRTGTAQAWSDTGRMWSENGRNWSETGRIAVEIRHKHQFWINVFEWFEVGFGYRQEALSLRI